MKRLPPVILLIFSEIFLFKRNHISKVKARSETLLFYFFPEDVELKEKGEEDVVSIREATYELVKDDPSFSFESRGKSVDKGNGEMGMYFVVIGSKK